MTDQATALPAPRPPPSNDQLEAEILKLAAQIAAATYRILTLIAEFDGRKGWSGWGVRSCAHWLNWKCGIGMNAAREEENNAHLEDGPGVSAETFERLACDCGVVEMHEDVDGNPLNIGRKARAESRLQR